MKAFRYFQVNHLHVSLFITRQIFEILTNSTRTFSCAVSTCGARGGRTLTMSPSTDFKSVASADSAIAPVACLFYRNALERQGKQATCQRLWAFCIFLASRAATEKPCTQPGDTLPTTCPWRMARRNESASWKAGRSSVRRPTS